MKTILALLAIVVIGGAYYYYATTSGSAAPDMSLQEVDNSSAMRAEENMVVVSEQRPGGSVTGSIIYLAASGYLVIHEDKNGEPGAILGASSLLQTGESAGVSVRLSRASKDGETLHAMLHAEKGGNATFSPAEDTPVQSVLGGPIHGIFEISNDAPEEAPITI